MASSAGDVTRKASLREVHRLRLTGATIEVISGPDAGLSVEIGATGIVVGAGTSCDLQLTDTLVSRRHVELVGEEDGVRVVDQDSTNGTLLHGALVRDVLVTGDVVLVVGDSSLSVRMAAEPLDVSVSPRRAFGGAIAESGAMRYVFALLEKAAQNDVTVLLEGDSGTGKDVLATALHDEGRRAEGPYVVVDCGAIPDGLFESELFGHEKGAFTGAHQRRAGAFEQADGGTLFLDEVGELPLGTQPKLLRALENRSFRRVGGAQTVSVDVRVIAATNRRLREMVRRREFREDLFYRLAVVHVRLPRLGDRPEDVIPLAERFLAAATCDDAAKIPDGLAALLRSYPWPGNARELRNVVERFATFDRTDASLLFPGALDAVPKDGPAEGASVLAGLEGMPYHEAKKQLMDRFHEAILPRAVERAGDSVARAARELGLPRASLYRMLQQLKT